MSENTICARDNGLHADISRIVRGVAATHRPHREETMHTKDARFTANSSKSNRMNCETQHCKHCDVWYRCLADKRQHERTLKHQRNLGLIPPPINHLCTACNTVIKGSNSKFRHEQTEKHKGRVKGIPPQQIYIPLQSQSQTSPQHRRSTIPIMHEVMPTFTL